MPSTQPLKDKPDSRTWLIAASFVLLAFIVRVIYLNQLTAMPTFDHPIMDEQYHLDLASKIISPAGYGHEPFYRAPLYPYFFALIYQLTHHSLYWSRFIQLLLGSCLPLLLFLLGTRFFNRRVALIAALVSAIYPTFIYHDVTILITSMKTLFAALILLQLYRTDRRLRYLDFALSGVLLGLATLARPNFAVLAPALLIWVWISIKPRLGLKQAFTRFALFGLCMIATIAPVTIRNYQASGEFVPIGWQGGFNFFLGNSRAANGWSAAVPGLDYSWDGGYRDAIAVAENQAGHQLERSEVSDYWYSQGWHEIKEDPAHFFGLAIKKVRLFFTGYEIPNNEDMYVVRQFSWVMAPLMFSGPIDFPYGILAPLGLIGLAFSIANWRKFLLIYLFLTSYVGSFLFFFVCARYRQPIIPFMILFAVYGVTRTIELAKHRNFRTLAFTGFAFLCLIVFSNYDRLGIDQRRTDAENQFAFGNVFFDKGDLDRATGYYRAAVASDSTFAPPYMNLGIVYSRIRRTDHAIAAFSRAIQLEPNTVDIYVNLSALYATLNDIPSAVRWLEKGRDINPLSASVHARLAALYFSQHQLEASRKAALEALRLDPARDDARQVLRELDRVRDSSSVR